MRRTGHESDRQLHLELNAGIPIRDPAGGFYFVFMAGPPAFRKYDADGEKERTVQFRGAGVMAPSSLSFTERGRLLVTPGCYEFLPG